MNLCVISGTIQNNAIVRGKKTKALVFTVATKQPPNGDADNEGLTSFVPCVMFNPPADVEQTLTDEGAGMNIELQGRVNANRQDPKGETRSNAEVVVYNKSVRVSR